MGMAEDGLKPWSLAALLVILRSEKSGLGDAIFLCFFLHCAGEEKLMLAGTEGWRGAQLSETTFSKFNCQATGLGGGGKAN